MIGKRGLKRLLRAAFLLAAVALGAYALADQWPSVRGGLARLTPGVIAGSLAAVLAALAASMMTWRALLADLGSPLPVRPAARVFFVSQLGKYIPGSLWPVLAQMEMGRDLGVPRARSATAFFLSLPVYVATGLVLALVTVPGEQVYGYAWLLLPLLVLLHPRIVNGVLGLGLRLLRREPLERPLTFGGIGRAFLWAFAAWLLYGAHLGILVAGLGGAGPRAYVLSAGAFALAFCLGIVVIVAPAGAGVREAAMVAALAPVLGAGAALTAALCSRLIVTAGDLASAGIAALVARRRVRAAALPEPGSGDAPGGRPDSAPGDQAVHPH
ncbi:lysylphosphatidylglycerol synthase domain-containing protein [Bailinhaonella thermotolerans]|uniref:UPF0104 family protein n=1 Tax=Bailinhaonella thermotolerans TaxID=1070861 RepID=A0A3A4BGR5_9ACTN|nr:lysylphosphatidylglycerol synthase domain-containing protein [Bailinhaonella thermotolerans]RJL30492.1 UPF0104 family protein [Bailinhaonella thermotolerans]